jgi:hypothetical protein
MSAYPYVRELGMDEFVGAHHQTRSLFHVIDKYGHVETIDGVIVALIDVLIWHVRSWRHRALNLGDKVLPESGQGFP